MTRYLLDTNIVSEAIKPVPSQALLAWLGGQKNNDLHIASLTVAEIKRGILGKPRGRKRDALDAWFAGPEGPQSLFAGRILPFDERAGLVWAELMAKAASAGRPRSALDTIIASVAVANGCVVVTGNERHFPGMDVVDPMRGGA